MRRSHIAIIIVIAVAVGAIVATINDASTYVGFVEASDNPGTQYTVIGYLDKEESMDYDARSNKFVFGAVDKEGNKKRVIYNQPKPQDFERSEEITMKGYCTDTAFIANEILMKCPSKYNETNELEGYETYQ